MNGTVCQSLWFKVIKTHPITGDASEQKESGVLNFVF